MTSLLSCSCLVCCNCSMLRTQLGNVYNRLHCHSQVERSQAAHRQALGRLMIIFFQWHARLPVATETVNHWRHRSSPIRFSMQISSSSSSSGSSNISRIPNPSPVLFISLGHVDNRERRGEFRVCKYRVRRHNRYCASSRIELQMIFAEEMLETVAASTINRVRAHVLALLGANTNDWRNGSSAQEHGTSGVKWLWRLQSQNKLHKQITKITCICINICVLNVVYGA